VEQEHISPVVVIIRSLGFVVAASLCPTRNGIFAGAAFAVASPIQHAPNCDHVNCFVVELLLELPQLFIHACCETQAVGELQQKLLRPQEDLKTFQPQTHMHQASTSIAVLDSRMQLQEPTGLLSHARQLQAIPYPVGGTSGASVLDSIHVAAIA
jgi:hypothetical protein